MKVVLDIETVQAPRKEWGRLAGIESIADGSGSQEYSRDLFAHTEMIENMKKEDELYERSSFDGTYSRIVCIGLLVFSSTMEPHGAMSWYGTNEEELLRRFWEKLGVIKPSLFITHNGLGFDMPFLKKRSMICQVKPSIDISLAKFRTDPVYDTMEVWGNWDMRGRVKLDVLARVLNVETKSGSGKQVSGMWDAGQGKKIAEYCLQDTYVTYACYQRMNFREPLSRKEILENPQIIDVG